MGKYRLVIEAGIRDIMTLLQRCRCAPDLMREIHHFLQKMLQKVCTLEESIRKSDVPSYPICESIVTEIVNTVAAEHAPQRNEFRLEEYRKILVQKIADLQKILDHKDVERQCVEAQRDRHDAAGEYSLNCYFKEVLSLRQIIHGQALLLGEKLTDNFSIEEASLSLKKYAMEIRAAQKKSKQRPSSPMLRSSSSSLRCASPIPEVSSLNLLSPEKVLQDNQASVLTAPTQIPTSSDVTAVPASERPRGVSPSLEGIPRVAIVEEKDDYKEKSSSPTHTSSSQLVPLQFPFVGGDYFNNKYSCDAIFDYHRYIQLREGEQLNLVKQLDNLREEFEEYKEWAKTDAENAMAQLKNRIEAKDEQICEFQARVRALEETISQMRKKISAFSIDQHQDLQKVKAQILSSKSQFVLDADLASKTQNEIAVNVDLFLKYVQQTNNFLHAQINASTVTSSNPKNPELAEEAFSRTQFQNALLPSSVEGSSKKEEESYEVKTAKLYWRKHPVTNVMLSTVVAVRKCATTVKELLKRMQLLETVVPKLQAEKNNALVRIQSSVDLAKSASMGSILANRVSPTSSPQSPDGAATASIPGPSRLTPAEIAKLLDDRKLLLKIFSAGKDEDFEMSGQDRNSILKSELSFHSLFRQRCQLIFRRVARRLVHRKICNGFRERLLEEGFSEVTASEYEQQLSERFEDYEVETKENAQSLGFKVTQETSILLSVIEKELLQRIIEGKKRKPVPKPSEPVSFPRPKTGNYVDTKSRIRQLHDMSAGGAAGTKSTTSVTSSPSQKKDGLERLLEGHHGDDEEEKMKQKEEGGGTDLDPQEKELEQGDGGRPKLTNIKLQITDVGQVLQQNKAEECEEYFYVSSLSTKHGMYVPTLGGIGSRDLAQKSLNLTAKMCVARPPGSANTQRKTWSASCRPKTGLSPKSSK